jgi:hypothetical protein
MEETKDLQGYTVLLRHLLGQGAFGKVYLAVVSDKDLVK